jgi:pyridoxal biosynthesis lyase PdxS
VEAQILESIGVDFIDESEVLTPADETHHINKHNFKVPVLCGCRNLGEALRRIAEVRCVRRAPTQSPACAVRLWRRHRAARHRTTSRHAPLPHAVSSSSRSPASHPPPPASRHARRAPP